MHTPAASLQTIVSRAGRPISSTEIGLNTRQGVERGVQRVVGDSIIAGWSVRG
ncbi:hypothetical protein CY34DRAFT_811830 [Suillus luteus UH-Slu-Lm8-n1]|uniref:Unplaced genomic scaffold CY34scaffold_451, whole genome shotgun sequence n=1 Tax=Suillus luteus UH-Slu-Lm8-n1 TaxID=930992 RepID=A0A0D0ANI6_9AGAM|nr:hypothetical protein CY34DRAFT_811830 [Suillus luteus UH-Slu-Lm8-n1]